MAGKISTFLHGRQMAFHWHSSMLLQVQETNKCPSKTRQFQKEAKKKNGLVSPDIPSVLKDSTSCLKSTAEAVSNRHHFLLQTAPSQLKYLKPRMIIKCHK